MNTLFALTMLLAANTIPDGTLLFVENGSPIVQNETNSPYSHVAIIVNIDNVPWVYEANSPRVRKIKLDDFVAGVQKLNAKRHRQRRLWIMTPKEALTEAQSKSMHNYLESQLGKRYSINGYLSGEQKDDRIHCGELTTWALRKAGKTIEGNASRHVPGSIMDAMKDQYQTKEELPTSARRAAARI